MRDIAASVLDRLNNKAKESGRSNQLCLQLFCQEEFLRRLSKSQYAENLILKGGLFLYQLTGFESRLTHDIDFLMHHIPNTEEKLSSMLEDIFAVDTGNSFVSYELTKMHEITKDAEYPGIEATIVGCIKNTRTRFCIDFGIGDAVIPSPARRRMLTQLKDFSEPEILTYSLESTIAEKLDAILSLMEYSSRMKDYYDLYWIPLHFNFDGNILTQAIRATFSRRKRNFSPETLTRVLGFRQSENMQRRWDAYTERIGLDDIAFEEILKTIGLFIEKPFQAAISGSAFTLNWNPDSMEWK